ncbi:hypothetical protein AB0J43_00070 [Nonomuraea fuscirosea]
MTILPEAMPEQSRTALLRPFCPKDHLLTAVSGDADERPHTGVLISV